jgi:hypothetical protein
VVGADLRPDTDEAYASSSGITDALGTCISEDCAPYISVLEPCGRFTLKFTVLGNMTTTLTQNPTWPLDPNVLQLNNCYELAEI